MVSSKPSDQGQDQDQESTYNSVGGSPQKMLEEVAPVFYFPTPQKVRFEIYLPR